MSRRNAKAVEGEPAYIKAGLLQADPDYQRVLDPKRVSEMVENWDPRRARVPQISKRRNGTYAIMDGQHTVAAIVEKFGPDCEVFCEVFTGLSREDEAEIFDQQKKGVVPPSAYSTYRSRVFRGEPVASTINDIVTDAGLTVSSARGKQSVVAINALERVHRVHKTLKPTLEILNAWGDGQDDVFDGRIIRMLGCFLKRYHSRVEKPRVVNVLLRHSPQKLLAKATDKHDNSGRPVEVCGALTIREWYNSNLKGRKLVLWDRGNGSR